MITLYDEVNKVLELFLANVKEVLQEQFLGMYLYGSLASGDFNIETSDIDFVVVTTTNISEGMYLKLSNMH
jgi:predicted nucleotidyltransferase